MASKRKNKKAGGGKTGASIKRTAGSGINPDRSTRSGETVDAVIFSQNTIAPTLKDYFNTLNHSSDEETVLNMVSFYLADKEYAIEAGKTVEVVKPRPLTEVPGVPDFIEGVLSLRGEMVMVLNLRKRLGMKPFSGRASEQRILIVRIEGEKVGLLVDRVVGVIEAPLSLLEPNGGSKGGPGRGFVKGVVRLGGKQVHLLSIERLTALKT